MIVLADEVYEPMDVEPKAVAAELRILNAALVPSPGYVGVALLGGSKIIGANQVRFADPALYDGKETVPAERQFIASGADYTASEDD